MSKFNESEDSGIVSEIVCGVVGVAAAGVVAWFGKKNFPKIKESFFTTKERLKSSLEAGVQGWKDYKFEPQPEKEDKVESVPDTDSVNPFEDTELPEVKAHTTDKGFEETLKPAPLKKQAVLKKCSRNCGSVLQGLDVKVGICANCQSKMRCKSCNNQLKKEEWGSALCLPCIQGIQCEECRAITPLGKEVKHAKSCQHFQLTLSEKIVLPNETASVEPQEDFLEALEAEVSTSAPLAVCENCGQMYTGSTCDKCSGTTTKVPAKRRTRSKKA